MSRERDDAMAVRVRDALQARADLVGVTPDALSRIRARTTRRRRGWAIGLAALATAAAGTAAVVVALGSGAPPRVTEDVPPATQAPPSAPAVARLPIYYVADVDGTPVLYREFRPVSADTAGETLPDRIRAAVEIMLAGKSLDPDFRGEWPGTVSIRAVAVEGEVAVLDLTGTMPTGTGGAMALQQLVWTVTAVAADRGVHLTGVLVRRDGVAYSDAPLTRGPALETLAPVWLISPQQGDTVAGTFDVHIAAVRGTPVRLRARDADGAVRFDRSVTIVAATPTPALGSAGAAPTRGEAHETVTLPPGRYTLEAYLAGGQSASDDHTVTVTAGPTTSAG